MDSLIGPFFFKAMVKVGDELPDVVLFEGKPDYAEPEEHPFKAHIQGKTIVLFGIPGAFTPSCSKAHLPSFIEHYDELKAAGVDLVICTATNDPFVMVAWAQASGVKPGTIKMLSDKDAKLCTALGLAISSDAHTKTQRYALVAKDGKVTHFFPSVKENGQEVPEDTYAPNVLNALKQAK